MMAIPIWIMEFFGGEVYSRFPSSKWKKELQVKETMDALLQALTIFPNVFLPPAIFTWNKYIICSNFFSCTFLNVGNTYPFIHFTPFIVLKNI